MSSLYARTFTVGTATAVQIVEPNPNGQHVYIHDHTKNASRDLFVGGPDVSVTNGFHILATESQDFVVPPGESMWAIATGGDISVQVLVSRV